MLWSMDYLMEMMLGQFLAPDSKAGSSVLRGASTACLLEYLLCGMPAAMWSLTVWVLHAVSKPRLGTRKTGQTKLLRVHSRSSHPSLGADAWLKPSHALQSVCSSMCIMSHHAITLPIVVLSPNHFHKLFLLLSCSVVSDSLWAHGL